MTDISRFMIAAAHKSSGKTVVSTGLAAAMAARLDTAVFKKGPDYIDPMWLSRATGRPAYNLDFNTMSETEIRGLFASRASTADVALVEANKGLFDGVALDGSDSNAALAKLLDLPVVLVIDTKGMTRGIAPLLQGYSGFDPDVSVAGVILNKTGGVRHESKLRAAVEEYTDLEVLGAIGASPDLDISERHLGLTTPSDVAGVSDFVALLGDRVTQSVDLDRILDLTKSSMQVRWKSDEIPIPDSGGLRIGIARDEAFGFYYPDDLEAFEAGGAKLIPIDMIRDTALPDIDGLFIGGGFPEVHAGDLAANASMRASVKTALAGGLPAYAECGGLMYLCKSLTWKGKSHDMVGFFDADTVMHDRPQGRGYARFQATSDALWPADNRECRAHEFHYARLENVADPVFARRITRGYGIDGVADALVKANTQAGFIHLRNTANSPWVIDFLGFIAAAKSRHGT